MLVAREESFGSAGRFSNLFGFLAPSLVAARSHSEAQWCVADFRVGVWGRGPKTLTGGFPGRAGGGNGWRPSWMVELGMMLNIFTRS
jgi:hypothetical protein